MLFKYFPKFFEYKYIEINDKIEEDIFLFFSLILIIWILIKKLMSIIV